MFDCEFFEVSKNTYFVEHLRTAASGIFLSIFFSLGTWKSANDMLLFPRFVVAISLKKVIQLTDSLLNCGETPILLIHIFWSFLFVYFMSLMLMIFGRTCNFHIVYASLFPEFVTFSHLLWCYFVIRGWWCFPRNITSVWTSLARKSYLETWNKWINSCLFQLVVLFLNNSYQRVVMICQSLQRCSTGVPQGSVSNSLSFGGLIQICFWICFRKMMVHVVEAMINV